ncbi:meiosis 1 arrest protein-like isoform X2 [Oscarella lobularis]|uniref:meiosis 1 arrest protein-like isoform X2 n=1 Tax=Oscarella lobularis TaxID=121494 RepID=UPI003313ADD7
MPISTRERNEAVSHQGASLQCSHFGSRLEVSSFTSIDNEVKANYKKRQIRTRLIQNRIRVEERGRMNMTESVRFTHSAFPRQRPMADDQRPQQKLVARALLIDARRVTSKTRQNVVETLRNVFALASQLAGGSRIPFFGLYVLSEKFKCLHPLQHAKGNFSKISAVFDHLGAIGENMTTTGGSLYEGLREIRLHYERQFHTLKESEVALDRLELTILTGEWIGTAACDVNDAFARLEKEGEPIQRITLVQLTEELDQDSVKCDIPVLDINEAIALETTSGDLLGLEKIFKSWLRDSAHEREHLHLLLPSLFNKDLIIKCDLVEGLLSPAVLPAPCQSHFSLEASSLVPKSTPRSQLRLKAIKQIPVDSVCESVLYGQPWLVSATNSSYLDWEERETNQHNFIALSRLLYTKNLGLLLSETRTSVRGHFLVIASGASSLLLKTIATRELMLPFDFERETEKPPEDAMRLVEKSLSRLVIADAFNPLHYESNLYPFLTSTVLKSAPATRQVKRKLPVPPGLLRRKMDSSHVGPESTFQRLPLTDAQTAPRTTMPLYGPTVERKGNETKRKRSLLPPKSKRPSYAEATKEQ